MGTSGNGWTFYSRRISRRRGFAGSASLARHRFAGFCAVVLLAAAGSGADAAPPAAGAKPAAVAPVAGGCPRPAQGDHIQEPPFLSDPTGSLTVYFSFQTATDAQGRTLYCYLTPSGLQNPTLYVAPGGTLTVTVTNNTPAGTNPMTIDGACFDPVMDSSSMNIHYHGTNTSPACGHDEVIKTVINSGETFTYTLNFPADEPPGMYWYHPHVHGNSDPHVMGGATGVLIVDGIESFFPALGGMTRRSLVLRDQQQFSNLNEGPYNCGNGVPYRDVSVNNVPVNSYTTYQGGPVIFAPASLTLPLGQSEFWRVANTSADTILDLQLIYAGVVQTLNLIAIDGVPVNSQDGTQPASSVPVNHFRLPPASRVEFVVRTPAYRVASAQLVTNNINTGPAGDCDPNRPLLAISTFDDAARPKPAVAAAAPRPRPLPAGGGRRFAGLGKAAVNAYRTVWFAEDNHGMYMVAPPQPQQVFGPNMTPGISTTQGAVEQWIVQNRTTENHEFHIHQIHFLLQSQNDFGSHPTAPGITGQYLDMVEVPAWSGNIKDRYPSVTLLMDFRGDTIGDFVFHCHILQHEDAGMMNIVQVNPANGAALPKAVRPRAAKPAAHRH
jgi:FtsP/CotA-like multicopper oxidase with cupredoxin domain